jgi:hypothetical protein
MLDKRSEPRRRRLKSGRIRYNNENSVMTCALKDLSANGARLAFGEAVLTPLEFDLEIPGEVDRRPAERVWMTKTEIGVRFPR